MDDALGGALGTALYCPYGPLRAAMLTRNRRHVKPTRIPSLQGLLQTLARLPAWPVEQAYVNGGRPRKAERTLGTLAFVLALSLPVELHSQQPVENVFFLEENNELVHPASGLRFPAEMSGFVRSDAAVLSEGGEYIGVEYTRSLSPDGTLTLRAAVVRIPGLSPAAHYVITKPVAMASLGHSRRVAEGPYERVEGSAGYRGLYTGTMEGRSWMRGLWAFERGEWDLRIAADFPRIDLLDADEAIELFVEALGDANPR